LTQVTSLSIIHGKNNDNPYSLSLHPVFKFSAVEAIMDQTFIIEFLCQHLRPDLLKTLDLSGIDTAFLKLFKKYRSIEALTLNLTDTYSLNQIRSLYPNLVKLELTYASDTKYDFSVLQQLANCSQLTITENYVEEWGEEPEQRDELQLPKTQDFDVLSKMPGLRYLELCGISNCLFDDMTFPGLETLIIRGGGLFDPEQYNITETYFDEVAADIKANNPTLRTLIFDGPNFRHQWNYPE
jgi:hypothetical protein